MLSKNGQVNQQASTDRLIKYFSTRLIIKNKR